MNRTKLKTVKIICSLLLLGSLVNNLMAQEMNQNQEFQTFESYKNIDYNQTLRPQFHFSSRRNWINDPNGMVFYDSEYHLYFQHNPLGINWGNMTWGHAVSTDMIHWQQLPHAILPYGKCTIFSGSALVDEKNVLGRQNTATKTIYALFTAWGKGQLAAYSTDKGRSFQLLNNGDAIVAPSGINKGERDPYIFWHEQSQKWMMLLWIKKAATEGTPTDKMGKARFYSSTNLTDWKIESDFDRTWIYECMNLIELPVDGNKNNKKWVVFDAGFHYETGDFDGHKLVTDSITCQGDYGKNFYAPQTFNNSPDGRRVLIGWMNGSNKMHENAAMPFSGQFSFPSELSLKTTKVGVRLYRWPIKEIKNLYTQSICYKNLNIGEAAIRLAKVQGELIDFSIEFETKESLNLSIRGLNITYNAANESFEYDKHSVPASPEKGTVSLRVLVDRSSIELFANGGAAVASFFAIPPAENKTISVSGTKTTRIHSLEINTLKSIWE